MSPRLPQRSDRQREQPIAPPEHLGAAVEHDSMGKAIANLAPQIREMAKVAFVHIDCRFDFDAGNSAALCFNDDIDLTVFLVPIVRQANKFVGPCCLCLVG
jgi:hypothetical protein